MVIISSLLRRMSHFLAPHKTRLEGMKSLDREAFAFSVPVPAVRVPSIHLNKLLPVLKSSMLRGYIKVSPVVPAGDTDGKYSIVRLDQSRIDEIPQFETETKPKIESFAERINADLDWCTVELQLAYENFQPTHIFDAILPGGMQFSSYSSVGHIIHVNLRDEMLPYKEIIGQVLLDKIGPCKTVVNKLHEIGDSKFRHFQMEVLAGEPKFDVELKESGCIYRFDFSKVYWNSRLAHEHERIVKKYLRKPKSSNGKANVILYDCCAGVGPFAIPAAKIAGCQVLANDLNPDGYRYLCENIRLNHVKDKVSAFNLDATEFVNKILSTDLAERLSQCSSSNDDVIHSHSVMNLPAFAVNFLPSFSGIMSTLVKAELCQKLTFFIHCYLFTKNAENPEESAKEMVKEKLKYGLFQQPSCSTESQWSIENVHHVRSVAGFKEMFCVTVLLKSAYLLQQRNEHILCDKTVIDEMSDCTPVKRLKKE